MACGLFMGVFEIKRRAALPRGISRGCTVGLHGGEEKEDITNHNYSSVDQSPSRRCYESRAYIMDDSREIGYEKQRLCVYTGKGSELFIYVCCFS